MRISHQYVLLGLQAHLIVLGSIVTAYAGAARPTNTVVGEAFAVELQAA